MNTGFFFYNMDPSKPDYYIYSRVYKLNSNEPDDYPISIQLLNNGVHFYLHGFIEPDYYSSGLLFFLPISNNTDGELTELLKKFTILKNKDKDKYSPIVKSYIYTKESSYFPSYSSLNCFSLDKEAPKSLYLHEIILDFLFDFFHSNVFCGSANYKTLKTILDEHKFMKLIIAKADCYYYKNLIAFYKEEEYDTISFKRLESRYEQSTKRWLSFIRQNESADLIHPHFYWFTDIETEHQQIYFPKSTKNDWLKKESEDSIQWLLSRYNILDSIKLQVNYIFGKLNYWLITFLMLLLFLILFLRYYTNITNFWRPFFEDTSAVFQIILLATILLVLLFVIFCICYILKLFHFKNLGDIALSLPKFIHFFKLKILITNTVVWAFIFTNSIFWSIGFQITRGGFIIIFGFVFFISIYMASKFSSLLPLESKLEKFLQIFKRSLIILLLSIPYSFIIGAGGMSISTKDIITKDISLERYFQDTSNIARLDSLGLKKLKKVKNDSLKRKDDYFKEVLPHLYFDADAPLQKKVLIKKDINSHFTIYIFPEMLVFYVFLTICISIFIEMAIKSIQSKI